MPVLQINTEHFMKTILTRLQESFATWYSSSSKKRHSNASLREQAVNCLSHYTHREVSEAIGMSITTLRSWQKSLGSDQGAIDSPSKFVAISLDPAQYTDETKQAPLTLQISLPSGILIKVESTSTASSVALIAALNKESNLCSI
jgi:hypothetical protein